MNVEQIKDTVEVNKIVVFAKGTKPQPMCGFSAKAMDILNRTDKPYEVVNLRDLGIFGEGATVDAEALAGRGLIGKAGARVKLLGDGDAPKGCTIKVHKVSGSALSKIEAAGGSVEIVS